MPITGNGRPGRSPRAGRAKPRGEGPVPMVKDSSSKRRSNRLAMKFPAIRPRPAARHAWHHALGAALGLAIPLGLAAAAWAEPPPGPPQPTSGQAARDQLESLRAEQKQAAERESRLPKEAAAFR